MASLALLIMTNYVEVLIYPTSLLTPALFSAQIYFNPFFPSNFYKNKYYAVVSALGFLGFLLVLIPGSMDCRSSIIALVPGTFWVAAIFTVL